MALWRIYYHIVWGTKERNPFITSEVEPLLYGYVLGKTQDLGGILHAIGGIENHIHLIVSIPPKMSVSDYVRYIKGGSTHYLKSGVVKLTSEFMWQRGYGVFSIGGKQLDDAIAYVKNQKSHHAEGTTNPALEDSSDDDTGPLIWKKGQAVLNIIPVRNFSKSTVDYD